jgi:hypothetical protein
MFILHDRRKKKPNSFSGGGGGGVNQRTPPIIGEKVRFLIFLPILPRPRLHAHVGKGSIREIQKMTSKNAGLYGCILWVEAISPFYARETRVSCVTV